MAKATTVLVAGAGIAGITAAYFARQRGHEVYLVEPAENAGGLLHSVSTAHGAFDCGTHVVTFTGATELDDFLFGGITENDFNFFNPGQSGNYFAGSFSEISPFVDSRALGHELAAAAEAELLENIPNSAAQPRNLEQAFLHRYGQTLSREIFAPVARKLMGYEPRELTPESINFFDMNRVLAFDAATAEKLKQSPGYDTSLAFHGALPGMQKVYPRRGGMGFWIEWLLNKLKTAGVNYLPACAIDSVTLENGRVTSVSLGGQQTLAVDQLVWSVAPALFARLTGAAQAEPPRFRATMLYDFAFQQPLRTRCYYLNVFDPDLLSARITVYANLTASDRHHACTVEVLADDGFDLPAAQPTVLRELATIGLVDATNPCVYQAMRRVNNGFPVPELEYTAHALAQAEQLDDSHPNVRFVGRGPGRFFMKDVMIHAFASGEHGEQ